MGTAWKYKWNHQSGVLPPQLRPARHQLRPICPHKTEGFLESIAPDNPLLRYSYEDHFIMRMGLYLLLLQSQPLQSRAAAHQRLHAASCRRDSGQPAQCHFAPYLQVAARGRIHALRNPLLPVCQVRLRLQYHPHHRRPQLGSLPCGGAVSVSPYGNSDILPLRETILFGWGQQCEGLVGADAGARQLQRATTRCRSLSTSVATYVST